MDINSVALTGNLGHDPEVKYFESGKAVATFSLACKRNRTKDSEWFDVECWEKSAKFAANYLKKGSKVTITGEIRFDHWADKTTGEPRRKPVVRVDSIEACGKGGAEEREESTEGLTPTPEDEVNLDDIPF